MDEQERLNGKLSESRCIQLPFDIDLNETPLSSPRCETPVSHHHPPPPPPPLPSAVAGDGSGGRGKVMFLDINALPTEAEGGGEEESSSFVYSGMRENSSIGNSNNTQVACTNLLLMGSQFDLMKPSVDVTGIIKSGTVDIVQQRLNFDRAIKEVDPPPSVFKGPHWAPIDYSTNSTELFQNQSEKFLQNLREFIFDNHGVLEEGWHVEFFHCQKRCKTFAVYCSPDGNKFESMFDVACHLGLVSNSHSLLTQDRNNGFALAQSRLLLHRRRKESLLFSRTKDWNECQENLKSSFAGNFLLGGAMDAKTCKSSNVMIEQVNSEPTNIYGSSHCKDGFPVQFEDFSVLSVGKIDSRPSYHCTSQIWPVGYKSSWHDKITGSLFVCDVIDGGDCGPAFKVQRYPCSKYPLPTASTMLFRPSLVAHNKKTDSTFDIDNSEDTDVQMILSDNSPPQLDFNVSTAVTYVDEVPNFQSIDGFEKNSNFISRNLGRPTPSNKRIGDEIGEFIVEGGSSSLVWRMVSEKLVHSCREVYKQTGLCEFFCRHAFGCWSSCLLHETLEPNESPGPLAKFCLLSGPFNTLQHVKSNDELVASCETLADWLGQDRFGLDIDFVQEIIEQLPGAHSCSDYVFLNKRNDQPNLQTVGTGFLSAMRQDDVQGEEETNSMLKGCKNSKNQHLNHSCPPGKPLSSKLPTVLIGDVLQLWELLWRFSEILGSDQPLSFMELEEELIDCCSFSLKSSHVSKNSEKSRHTITSDDTQTLNEGAKVRQAPDNHCRCTGEALYSAHCSLLKVLLEELQFKLAVSVDPSLESGESKSRKRRKKEADSMNFARKSMLDLLPINELTWPELARRYLLTVSSMESSNLDSPEAVIREACKVFHCLQGDSGALHGSPPGVALMEADALLLAESMKQIFGASKNVNDNLNLDSDDPVSPGSGKEAAMKDGEFPEWARALEPVRKLPTNVGARIRRCIHDALALNPPEWATKILEYSISKEVYKGNASGPTKKAVLSVLADVCGETPQQKPSRKRKGKCLITWSDVIMEQCRKVLRRAAAADEEKVFCNLLGRTLLNTSDNDDEGLLGFPAMVSRPLDFRTIDLRLSFGAYGGSHEAFLEDVREVWHHIRTAYADESDLVHLAETLSQTFEALYEQEVLTLVQKFAEHAALECSSSEVKKEMEDILGQQTQMPKAPWDEGVCKVCGVDKDDDNVLLCDKCDSGYHTYCLDPPLARIPEGNWYCPSCISQGASQVSQFISHCRKRRPQGEITRGILEVLAHLGTTMEITDYWDCSVEERIFLLKFLGDEVLNSACIREYLDRCASVSADLQQKLRSLSTEWRNLKLKEEIVAEKFAKANEGVLDSVGKSEKKGTPNVLPDYDNLREQSCSGNILCSTPLVDLVHLEGDQRFLKTNNFMKQPCLVYPRGAQEQQSLNNGNHCLTILDSESEVNQPDMKESQTSNPEAIIMKNKLSVLQESITGLELQLQKASLRKEFLGRDSAGRLYWAFSRPDSCPWVVVDGTTVMQQKSIVEETMVLSSNNLIPMLSFGAEYLLKFKRSNVFCPYSNDLTDEIPVSVHWFSHHSDAEIEELIKWLRVNDPVQRELIESLLQLLKFGYDNSNENANHVSEANRPALIPVNIDKTVKCDATRTKALTALEKKYGPCTELDVTNISVRPSQNEGVTHDDKMCRCECLEPIWLSRHHCHSCHWSFSSMCELEEHNDGRCRSGTYAPAKSRVIDDVSRERVVMRAEHGEHSGKVRQCKSGNARNDMSFGLIGFRKDFTSPYQVDEISAKFITRSSNMELVTEIGFLGSNGIPSFVPCASPYLSDPALKLVLPWKNEVRQSDQSTDVESRSLQGDATTCKRHAIKSNLNKNGNAVDIFEELQKIGRSYLMTDKICQSSSRFSCTKLGNPLPEIRSSALRRLVGKGAQILRQLKINLLDMDAAVPEEALKSSFFYLEKRCAWRAFVKSSKSVFEMVQATIVFENVIKTDYLRNEWWYWSSLSAAAKIATLSALALRIYTLDAAILYEKTAPFSAKDIEVGKSDNTSSPHPEFANNPRSSSRPVLRSHNLDPTDSSKSASRSGKKRKDLGG